MTREEVLEKVNAVIQDVFDDDSIRVSDETVASDVDGWDSLMHITLIGTKDVVGMKNVGQMVDLIMERLD